MSDPICKKFRANGIDPFCSKERKQRSDSKLVLLSSFIFYSLQKIVGKRFVTCFGAFQILAQ